jgi:1-pyrroline-5-carboxylate dehydrogenase
MWETIGKNMAMYRSYPRIVGETGGKDFVIAHKSADPDVVATALLRGAFEFQGQKCSAASRAYIPSNIAEGCARKNTKEYIQFLYVSLGSAAELETQLIISSNLGYIDNKSTQNLQMDLEEIIRMLTGLIKSLSNR